MKILYLKGYEWLLSQNQQIGNDFFCYIWYLAFAKHIKPVFKKNIKVKGIRCHESQWTISGSQTQVLRKLGEMAMNELSTAYGLILNSIEN